MIAAVYARKSTEQNGTSEEGKSVMRQIEHATAYAIKKGWAIAEEHVYSDDGISGAEFVKRPGFIRLMNALKPRPSFQVLIMSEESRLGREAIETAWVLKQIMDSGVRVFFYLEDRERTLDNAMDKVMLSLSTFAAEMEREKGRQRTYDTMKRKAESGYVAGGCVFGYNNVEVAANGKRQHVLRQINPDEAAIVERIFELYASGKGLTRIAKQLNREGIPPPRHGSGWAPSAIHAILRRPLYAGEIVWNVLEKYTCGGTKRRRVRPEREWLRKEVPELRIIPPALWQTVQDRLARTQATYARGIINGKKGAFVTRPTMRDLDPDYARYPLSGFIRCTCGGPFASVSQTTRRRHKFGCTYHWKRGPMVCTNKLMIDQDRATSAIFTRLADLLEDLPREKVIARVMALHHERQHTWQDRHAGLQRELNKVETDIQRVVDLLCRGGQGSDALLDRLREQEGKKKALQAELAQVVPMPSPVKNLEQEIRQRLTDTAALLKKDVPIARQMLRKLATEPIVAEALVDGSYRFTFKGSYAKLLPSVAVPPYVVSPTGFEPVLQP